MHFPIDSSTHYPAFHTVGLHYQTPTLTHCVPCREAVCTIFMMVFGMTRPGGELTTYRVRGGHATDWANPTRFTCGPYPDGFRLLLLVFRFLDLAAIFVSFFSIPFTISIPIMISVHMISAIPVTIWNHESVNRFTYTGYALWSLFYKQMIMANLEYHIYINSYMLVHKCFTERTIIIF